MCEAWVEGLANALVAGRAWAIEADVEALIGVCYPCFQSAQAILSTISTHTRRDPWSYVCSGVVVKLSDLQARRESGKWTRRARSALA